MSKLDAHPNDSEEVSQVPSALTPERKAALRERVSHLTTPDEHARLLAEWQENASKIIEIGQKLLKSSEPSSSILF